MRAACVLALVLGGATGAARAQFAPDVPPFTPADPTFGRPTDLRARGPYGDPSLSRQGPLATPHPMFDDPARRVFTSPPVVSRAAPAPAPSTPAPRAPALASGLRPAPPAVMTIEKAGDADASPLIAAPVDVGRALAACWRPPTAQGRVEATVRVSFTRRGGVLGAPKVTYIYAQDAVSREAVRASALAAVAACAPLRLSGAAASAIAGRVFAIRLIALPKGRQQNI